VNNSEVKMVFHLCSTPFCFPLLFEQPGMDRVARNIEPESRVQLTKEASNLIIITAKYLNPGNLNKAERD
jgi:hypothetical protein